MHTVISSNVMNLSRRLRVVPLVLAAAVGCTTGGDSVTPPKNNIDNVPWRLQLNYKAITMKVGDVLQLEATPVNVQGQPLTGLPPVTFTTSDANVTIDATGKITAPVARSSVRIYATVTNPTENWTIADTAQVTVVATPYTFSSFKMMLDGPTLLPAGVWRNFDAVLLDAAGNPLEDADGNIIYPNTSYWSSVGPDKFYLGNGGGSGRNLGTLKIRASAWIFGQVYQDSVNFTVTYSDDAPLYIYRVSYNLTPSPSMMSQTDVTVLQGGQVRFVNQNTTSDTDIVFDDLSKVEGGNIPVVAQYPGSAVKFPNLGKFTYKSSKGFTGTITVVERPTE